MFSSDEDGWRRGGSRLVLDGTDPDLTDVHIHRMAEYWRSKQEIIVTRVDESGPHAVAMSIAAACSGRFVVQPDARDGVRYATIVPPAEVVAPAPLPHPERPANVPARMKVGPCSVANDYRERIRHARDGPMPPTPVSIVVPVDGGRVTLGRTLACLLHQTYPLDLIEVVVVDEASSDRTAEAVESLRAHFGDVRYVRQPDPVRPVDVRNLGVRAAAHENVVILESTMAPVPRFVELHVRHLEAFPNAVYCGHRRHVDASKVTVEAVRTSITPMLALADLQTANRECGDARANRTSDRHLPVDAPGGDLRFEPDPFLLVDGGNLGFTRSLFDIVGGFDAGFGDPRAADVEWGFRVWNRGFYIVPLIDACGLHDGPPRARNEADRALRTSDARLVDLCPVRTRPSNNGGGFTVPLVSIYIPAYNAEDTIVSAVQSALDQTVRDLEVCVVNDGSTDATLARLTEHFRTEPRVRIGDQENGGIGAASNRAVRMCRGAFIGQLDADDELTSDAVELLLEPMLRETRIGVAYGSHVKIDPDGVPLGDAYVVAHYSHFVMLHLMIVHPFRLYRARDWHRTDGFAEDIRNAVDYDMFLKMSEVTEMVHVNERVYRYRIHDESTSRKHQAAQYRNHAVVVGRALERRGLTAHWAMEPLDPDDPRKYRFVETQGPRRPSALPTAHVRVVGARADLESRVASVLRNWRFEPGAGDPTAVLTSPRLSRERARRCADELRAALVDSDVDVEVAS